MTHGEQSERCTFHVSKADVPVILGLSSCRALQLVTLHYNMNVLENTAPENQQSTAQSTLTGDHDALRFTATTPGHQTQQDAELSELRDIIMTKWPDKRADCLARLHG